MAKLVASSRRSEHDVASIRSRFVAQSGLFPLVSSRCSSPSIAQTCQPLPVAPMRRIYVQIFLPTLAGPWDVSHNRARSKETRWKPEDMPLSCRLAWSRGKGILSFTWPAKGPHGGIRSRRMDKPEAWGSTPANCPKTNLARLESAMSTIHPTTNLTHPPHYMDKAVMWVLAEARESRARASVAVLPKY